MSVIRRVTKPVGSAAASVEVAWIWPCRSSFSTTKRTAASTVSAIPGSFEDRRVVHERRHRPALALEEGHAALIALGGKGDGASGPVQVRAGRVGPVQDGEGRIAEDAAQALLELAGCPGPAQLDHEAPGRRVAPLRLQLAGDEADRHDAVLLRRVQEPGARALAGGVVLEADLAEPGERVPDVRLVVDRQPPPAARVDIGEGAGGELGPLAGDQSRHASTILRFSRGRELRLARAAGG